VLIIVTLSVLHTTEFIIVLVFLKYTYAQINAGTRHARTYAHTDYKHKYIQTYKHTYTCTHKHNDTQIYSIIHTTYQKINRKCTCKHEDGGHWNTGENRENDFTRMYGVKEGVNKGMNWVNSDLGFIAEKDLGGF